MRSALVYVAVASLVFFGGCSSVYKKYLIEGYSVTAPGSVKRIVIAVSSPENNLSLLVASISRDLIRTNRNYLVYGAVAGAADTVSCGKNDGVLEININRAVTIGGDVEMDVTGTLHRCRDRKVLWEASARRKAKSANRSLENITGTYRAQYGETAKTYAAPVFDIIEDIIEALPNPVLTEDEVQEKIELEISLNGEEFDPLTVFYVP